MEVGKAKCREVFFVHEDVLVSGRKAGPPVTTLPTVGPRIPCLCSSLCVQGISYGHLCTYVINCEVSCCFHFKLFFLFFQGTVFNFYRIFISAHWSVWSLIPCLHALYLLSCWLNKLKKYDSDSHCEVLYWIQKRQYYLMLHLIKMLNLVSGKMKLM